MGNKKLVKSGGVGFIVISLILLFGLYWVHDLGSLSVKGIDANKQDDTFAFYFILIFLAVCCFYLLWEGLRKIFAG